MLVSTGRAGGLVLVALICTVVNNGASMAFAGFTTFSVGGDATTGSITPTVNNFRAAIGGANNGNTPGPLAGGRREINWDGGGATVGASAGTPFNGFRNNRGGIFTTAGTGFLQTPVDDPLLTGIQPSYATTFAAFSPVRIFVPLGSNVTDVTFAIPGTDGATPATVSGFGAIFSDVDLTGATMLEFFDVNNVSIFQAGAPAASVSSAGYSFLGALADAGEQIARVRITTGNAALGGVDSNGNPTDVVGMDDFIFAEPLAIPEPGSGVILAAGSLGLTLARRRR